jgi:hypothetical protein
MRSRLWVGRTLQQRVSGCSDLAPNSSHIAVALVFSELGHIKQPSDGLGPTLP